MPGSLVQSKSGNIAGTGLPLTITLDSPTTSGNALVVAISAYDTGFSPGWPDIYDGGFNTFVSLLDAWVWTVNSAVVQLLFKTSIVGRSSHVFTIQVPGTEYYQATVMELAGVKGEWGGASAEAQAIAPSGVSGTVYVDGAGGVCVAALTEDGGLTVSAVSAGWTEVYDGNTGQPLHVAVRVVPSGGIYECAFTYTPPGQNSSAGTCVGFEPKVIAGGPEYGAVAIAGAGGLAVTARRARAALTTIAALSSLATVARRTRSALAAIGAASTVSVVARSARRGAVAITGTSGLAVAAVEIAGPQELAGVTIAASSTVSANATSKRRTTVAIAGQSSLGASGLSFGPRRGAVSIDAFGRLQVSALVGKPGRGTTGIVIREAAGSEARLQPFGTTTVGGIE